MSETPQDPAGTTHQFQNFANQAQPPQKSGPNIAVIIGVIVAVIVVLVLVFGFITLG